MKTLTLPDHLYHALCDAARAGGHESPEAYLAERHREQVREHNRRLFERIRRRREAIAARGGPQTDSVELLREDRAR